MQNVPAAMRRHNCHRTAATLPPAELGIIMQIGSVPVVMVRLRDPDILRMVQEAAMTLAAESDDISERQQAALVAELLGQREAAEESVMQR
jgi:hypothetical protein